MGDNRKSTAGSVPANVATPVLRFAPSPTGYLHLGHAYSALLNARAAEALGGRLLLRIEDTDPGRCRSAYVDAIHEDLAWLGVRFDGEVRRQSEHMADYRMAVERLQAEGLLYRCAASRQDIRSIMGDTGPRDPDGSFAFRGRGLFPPEDGQPFALRLDMAEALHALSGHDLSYRSFSPSGVVESVAVEPERWGDVVIVGKDRPVAYHLASVVDDALQGVSHVMRGQDIAASTDVHRVLQTLLDLPCPLYHHHRLIRLEAGGRKLSKADSDKSLRDMRADGVSPADVIQMLDVAW